MEQPWLMSQWHLQASHAHSSSPLSSAVRHLPVCHQPCSSACLWSLQASNRLQESCNSTAVQLQDSSLLLLPQQPLQPSPKSASGNVGGLGGGTQRAVQQRSLKGSGAEPKVTCSLWKLAAHTSFGLTRCCDRVEHHIGCDLPTGAGLGRGRLVQSVLEAEGQSDCIEPQELQTHVQVGAWI